MVIASAAVILANVAPRSLQEERSSEALGAPSSGPDLIVTDISWKDCTGTIVTSGATIASGQFFSIIVTVKNSGTASTGVSFETGLYYNGALVQTSQWLPALASKKTATVTWSGLFESALGTDSFKAVVDLPNGGWGSVYEVNSAGHAAAEANNERTESFSVVNAKWSIAYVGFGDCNLEGLTLGDFTSIAGPCSSKDISASALIDRVPGETSTYGDWTTAKRFFITPGMTPTAENAIEDLGEINTGDPTLIANHIKWAFDRFKADRHALIMTGHGGWGIGYDVTSSGDRLTISELHDTLLSVSTAIGKKIDLVYLESCEMGNLEATYYSLQDSSSIVLAWADELVTYGSPPFGVTLASLKSNSAMLPEELATKFVDDFGAYNGQDSAGMALAAVREGQVAGLSSDVDALADLLIDAMPSVKTEIQSARSVTRQYDEVTGSTRIVDVADFASKMAAGASDQNIKDASLRIVDDVASSMIDTYTSPYYANLKPMGLYWPRSSVYASGEFGMFTGFRALDFAMDSNWDELIAGYYDSTAPTMRSFSINSGAQSTATQHVVLSISAADVLGAGEYGSPSGVYRMRFSNDNVNWKGWVPYASTYGYDLAEGPSGTRTVYCEVRDFGGQVSSAISGSIQYTDTEPARITVTSPNGGETWQLGSTHSITWTSHDILTGGVNIYLYRNGAPYCEITRGTANDGDYAWTILSNLPTGTTFKIRIQGSDTAYLGIDDLSDGYFSLAGSPTYTLTISVNNAAWGSTNPADGPHICPAGIDATVTAYPIAGYVFHGWLLDGVGYYSNPYIVVMDSDHTLQALFDPEAPQSFTLTINAQLPDGTFISGPWVKIDGITVGQSGGTFTVSAGEHTLEIQSTYHRYTFQFWFIGGPDTNPGTINVITSLVIAAIYYK